MHLDPLLPGFVAALWVVVALAVIGRRLGQPMPVIYMAAGIALGPHGLTIVNDTHAMQLAGEYGVILLLFLLGTEIKLDRLLAAWQVPVFGLIVQVLASLACVAALGFAAGWPVPRIVLIGFAISLSSTAVVLRLLEDRKLNDTRLGADILAILLAQDLALAPMIVVLGLLGGGHPEPFELALQGFGAVVLLGAVALVARAGEIKLPMANWLRSDSELQVFGALMFALTVALFSGLVGLSSAFGAFVAGVLIGATEEEHWVHAQLHPFRVVLVAVFLASVGMLVDPHYLWANVGTVASVALLALLTNTVINAGILKAAGRSWSEAWLGGALLSQIGEFSFVLAALGVQVGMLTSVGYQLTLSVIATTLLFSAVWISLVSAVTGEAQPAEA